MAHSNRGGKTYGVNELYKSFIPVSNLAGNRVARGALLGTRFPSGDAVTPYLVVDDDGCDVYVTLNQTPRPNGVKEQAGVRRWFKLRPLLTYSIYEDRRQAWDGYGSRVEFDNETVRLAEELVIKFANDVSAMWRYDREKAEEVLERLDVANERMSDARDSDDELYGISRSFNW